MVSEKFRYQLRQEVEQWHSEGLIDNDLHEQLTQRYQFNELEITARNRFVIILLGLGSILLGLAVITFVAANWQEWSRSLKVTLLISLWITLNTTGFYLWRHPRQSWRLKIGEGLLLLGSLVLGANLALLSQMFHQSGPVYQLFLVWGVAVLIMAYSLKLTFLGIVSCILLTIGYCSGIASLLYNETSSIFLITLQHYPVLTSLLFIPLAYWCQSRWLFGLGILLTCFSLEVNLLGVLDQSGGLIAALACILPPAFLWGYQDSLFLTTSTSFTPLARNLGILFLSSVTYLLSFHSFWQYPPNPQEVFFSSQESWILLDLLGFGSLTILFWLRLGYRRQLDLTNIVVGTLLCTIGFLVFYNIEAEPLGAIAIFVINIILFLIAVGLVRQALEVGQRKGFWLGILLMMLQLSSRMFEYNTALIFKATCLFLCGIAIIAAGLWFERYLQALALRSEG